MFRCCRPLFLYFLFVPIYYERTVIDCQSLNFIMISIVNLFYFCAILSWFMIDIFFIYVYLHLYCRCTICLYCLYGPFVSEINTKWMNEWMKLGRSTNRLTVDFWHFSFCRILERVIWSVLLIRFIKLFWFTKINVLVDFNVLFTKMLVPLWSVCCRWRYLTCFWIVFVWLFFFVWFGFVSSAKIFSNFMAR